MINKRPNFLNIALLIIFLCIILSIVVFYPSRDQDPPTIQARDTSHPFLLFHDIRQTPGYQYRNESPWADWEADIIKLADRGLSKDFYARWSDDNYVSTRAMYAQYLGLAYQITGDPAYGKKAREALLNLDVGDSGSDYDEMVQLSGFSLAYDMVQPSLSSKDDMAIRDKLGVIADRAYQRMNVSGTEKGYISFWDKHGQWYPHIGVAGIVLHDYDNPNGLPLKSGPEDWIRPGTDYLFINDRLHDLNRPLVSFGWDAVGNDLSGAYRTYYIDDFLLWAQAYSHFYGKNFFTDYALAERAIMSDINTSIPGGYSNNYVTDGNVKYVYHRWFVNLLSDDDKSYALYHDTKVLGSDILPYSSVMTRSSESPPFLLYLTYGDYSSIVARPPPWTSSLNSTSIIQILRRDWSDDSDWLSLITYNGGSSSNRDLAHQDQLSFEYYSRGDLLLSDAGENRVVLDKDYGRYEVDHNTVAFEDPRAPFSLSSWANSPARGIYKGRDYLGVMTPVSVENIVQTAWIESVTADAIVHNVTASTWDSWKPLSSTIAYERTVLYPEKDYFIVVDRLEGGEEWGYRSIFRPASLNISPSIDRDHDGQYTLGEVGHVNGSLRLGDEYYDWLSSRYKTESSGGANISSFTWDTINPYGKKVELLVYTAPSSTATVNKLVGRIGGYDAPAEVFSPVVSFTSGPSKDLYRVTALLSSYAGEEKKVAEEVPVDGKGSALRISARGYEDYVYSGTGISSFAGLSTDSDTLFMRRSPLSTEYMLINGSSIDRDGISLLSTSKKVSVLTIRITGGQVKFETNNTGRYNLNLRLSPGDKYRLAVDGKSHNEILAVGDTGLIKLRVEDGAHTYQLLPQ